MAKTPSTHSPALSARPTAPREVVRRIAAALLGGYAFSWGFAALGIAALVMLGAEFHEAEKAVMIVAFLVFLVVFLWAFVTRRVGRAWLVLGGGAAVMTAAAWAIQHAVVG